MTNPTKQVLSDIDKRSFPRVSVVGKAVLSGPDLYGDILNFNHRGISFRSKSVIDSPELLINLSFPQFSSDVHIQPKWRISTESGDYIYGAAVMDNQKVVLNKIIKTMMRHFYNNVTDGCPDRAAKKSIFSFCKDLRKYVFHLADLDQKLMERVINNDQALPFLKKYTDSIVLCGEALKQKLKNELLISKVKKEFRHLVGPWAYKSQIVKRSYDKPKGYPGDYLTLETIYDVTVHGEESSIGAVFDMYFLANPYADAVRDRKNFISKTIKRLLPQVKAGDKIKILNLASGSCREIRELTNDGIFNNTNAEVACLDWDDDAVAFSQDQLKNAPPTLKFQWLKEDIVRFAREASFFKKNGNFNLVYSIGLADYLPDRVIKKLIATVYDGLTPGGCFILAHKDKEKVFSHLPPEWFCEWVFIERNLNEFTDLFIQAGVNKAELLIETYKSEDIFYAIIQKSLMANKIVPAFNMPGKEHNEKYSQKIYGTS